LHPVISDLSTLVAMPTISTRPVTEIAALLASRCEDLGFVIELFDDPVEAGKTNVVASIGPQRPGGLVLSGHMDVVPTQGQQWASDPFHLTERQGRLHGRGSADMKGFIAACLQALAAIDRGSWLRPLVLIWTHDEEIGCHGSAHLAHSWQAAGRSLPEACLIGEPTDFRLLRMHAGHVAARVQIQGQAAHTAFPELGANAVVAASMVVQAVADLAEQLRQEQGQQAAELARPWVPMSVVGIDGGSAMNIVPDRCEVRIGFRPLPGMDHGAIWERLLAAVRGLPLPPGTQATAEVLRVTPSLCSPTSTALERALAPHAEPGDTASAPFATDGGNLARLGATPLVFGPGSIAVAHKADEFIATADLIRSVAIIERLVRGFCCAS
jgi:acetylornithine deacetylase